MKKIIYIVFLLFSIILIGCSSSNNNSGNNGQGGVEETPGESEEKPGNNEQEGSEDNPGGEENPEKDPENNNQGGVEETPGENEEKPEVEPEFNITWLEGTKNCYSYDGTTLTFTTIDCDTVYAISGDIDGNIIINVGDEYKFDLELHGVNLTSEETNPIIILSGDEVAIKAKKDYENVIYDNRELIDETDETLHSAAIYSVVDLEIGGKGSLVIESSNNKGIHTKDDLQIKNLNLTVKCQDNALKGNDSVEIENATITLIAKTGDGIKTDNSDISEKGNQRGNIIINSSKIDIYAACDGIDSSYDVTINEDVILNIYTDKYSSYSEEVTDVKEAIYYIRYSRNSYKYSVKYYNSDTDFIWVDATFHSNVSGGRNSYYYYSFPKMAEYSKMKVFVYSTDMELSQENDYMHQSDYLSLNDAYDTLALSNRGNVLSYNWTNYSTKVEGGPGGMPGGPGGGPGGMQEGNSDKGDHSTKGIKAANQIIINGGTINIKSYDDGLHANNNETLENGQSPLGNITINNCVLTIFSNDDGIHADGTLLIKGGTVTIDNSYEGLEGVFINIEGGNVSVYSKDDGVNATTTTNVAITISGGQLYVYCSGDGIDSNSRTSYSGIIFSGGKTVIISNSNGNSAIDTENGYKYTGGIVVAIMPNGGMSSEATHCKDFNTVGSSKTVSLTSNTYVNINDVVTIKMPLSINGRIIYLSSTSINTTTSSSSNLKFDNNGVSWK